MKIRPANSEDSVAIFELVNQLHPSINVAELNFQATFDLILKRPDNCCFVVIKDGATVGYLSGFLRPVLNQGGSAAYVDEIVIQTDVRGAGLGTALLCEFENWAQSKHCSVVGLATGGARAFYERLGYQTSAGYYKKQLN